MYIKKLQSIILSSKSDIKTLACADPETQRNLSADGLQLKLRTWCPSKGSSCLNDCSFAFIPWKSYMRRV